MKRLLILITAVLLILAGTTSAVVAADKKPKDDTKQTSELCKKDGWKDVVDDDGKPFKNQGKCVEYTKKGGELHEKNPEPTLEIVDGTIPWDGYLRGTGYTPGAEISSVTFTTEHDTLTVNSPVGTGINEDGTFESEPGVYWCSEFHYHQQDSATLTVEDSAGKRHSEEVDLAGHCPPLD